VYEPYDVTSSTGLALLLDNVTAWIKDLHPFMGVLARILLVYCLYWVHRTFVEMADWLSRTGAPRVLLVLGWVLYCVVIGGFILVLFRSL